MSPEQTARRFDGKALMLRILVALLAEDAADAAIALQCDHTPDRLDAWATANTMWNEAAGALAGYVARADANTAWLLQRADSYEAHAASGTRRAGGLDASGLRREAASFRRVAARIEESMASAPDLKSEGPSGATPERLTTGALLRSRRESAGLSLRKLQASSGIPATMLREAERNERPLLLKHWRAIVTALPGLTLADLAMAAVASGPVTVDAREGDEDERMAVVALLVRAALS